MNIQEILQSATSLAGKYGKTDLAAKFSALATAIRNDKLKVVVLGDFKAGKSTLLNRLFIRKNLLPTDYMEATAVPTHLSNGPMGMNTWMRNPDGDDVLVTERRTFGDAEVAATVTASTEQERADKAGRYSKVCITMPGILPDNIILVDTPGLNTTNTAIYTGTLEEARTADAILYVVRAKQLSSREEALIVDLAGSQKLKVPMHVVLTHDKAAGISEGQLENICQTIKAQLKLKGLNCGVSIFSIDGTEEASSSLIEKIDTTFGDSWGWDSTPPTQKTAQADTNGWGWDSPAPAAPSAPAEVPTAPVRDLEAELLAFFNGEVNRGRMARIARELKPMLYTLISAIETRLALAGAKEEDIKKLEAGKVSMQKEYLRVVESLLLDVRSAQQQFSNAVETDLDDLRKQYEKELKTKGTTGDILACISDWQTDIPERLQRVLNKRKLDLQRDIDAISLKHHQDLMKGLAPEGIKTVMPSDWVIKIVSFVPNWMLQLADYVIFDLISPLPVWLDVLVRMFVDKIPGIRNLMPANIAAALARNMAIDKLGECVKAIKGQVHQQLDDKFNDLNAKLRSALTQADIFAEQDAAIAEVRAGTLTPEQKQQLLAEKAQIASWGLEI
ncbi:MAG: dynamin family protein [Akkermansia sp.]|nr:dynamin family protein [Akkermansia sp.]